MNFKDVFHKITTLKMLLNIHLYMLTEDLYFLTSILFCSEFCFLFFFFMAVVNELVQKLKERTGQKKSKMSLDLQVKKKFCRECLSSYRCVSLLFIFYCIMFVLTCAVVFEHCLPYLPVYNARPCIIRTLFLDYDFGKKINKRKEEVQ